MPGIYVSINWPGIAKPWKWFQTINQFDQPCLAILPIFSILGSRGGSTLGKVPRDEQWAVS